MSESIRLHPGIQTGGERHLHQWAKVPAPTRTSRTCTPDVARGPHVQTSGASQLPFQASANPCCMCELPQLRLHCSCRAMPQSPGLQTQLLLQQQHAARSNQPCVLKWFKTGAVYEETYFEQDLEAISRAQELIDAYNAEGLINKTIQLNHPGVKMFQRGSR